MRIVAAVIVGGVLLAGCGNETGGGAQTPSEPPPSSPVTSTTQTSTPANPTTPVSPTSAPAPKRTGTAIKTARSEFGTILFDGTGQAIYLFDKERSTKPECYGACAEAWPPVLTKGGPAPRGAVKQALLGTTKRTDGTTQVTYGGHPLYFYAHEGKNEVKCHNVDEFGGLWLVVTPAGRAAD